VLNNKDTLLERAYYVRKQTNFYTSNQSSTAQALKTKISPETAATIQQTKKTPKSQGHQQAHYKNHWAGK
jgi:protease II